MDAFRVANIHRDHHARIGNLKRLKLCFSQQCGRQLIGLIVERRNLDEVKREIALPPFLSPSFDQLGEQLAVLQRSLNV